MSFDDPFAGIEPKKPKRKPNKTFDKPLDVSRQDVSKVTGKGKSVMHGKYYQMTTRLPEDVVEAIRWWANELNMTQEDIKRYCFFRGLEALEEGERPEVEEVVVKKRLKR